MDCPMYTVFEQVIGICYKSLRMTLFDKTRHVQFADNFGVHPYPKAQ